MKHELYYQDDTSNKFWTIELKGTGYITSNGRIGSSPRTNEKDCGDVETAKKQIEKLVKSKLKKGYKVGVPPSYEKPDWSAMKMNDEIFWRIINLLNWKKTGDDNAVLKYSVQALSEMEVSEIEKFEDIMSEKLFTLDTLEHAKEIGEEAYREGKYFSNDWFLYCRCCVVANGNLFYKKVLKNAKSFPKDLEFEALLSIAREAYEMKTNEEWNYFNDKISYETYSNGEGWKVN